MEAIKIAVVGGSGLYNMPAISAVETLRLDTPFGKPSGAIRVGSLSGKRVAFVPRHGEGHALSPATLPYRANIYALKTLGVKQIVSVSAVGSLQARLEPQHMVVPDQLIDRTRGLRPSTFFEDGVVAHISFADPFCPEMGQILADGAKGQGIPTHQGATMVVMEGPAFSTKAESEMYRSWGGDLIGMTALPEAKLAREAEICYATMAWVTDYDCWHPDHDAVTVDMVVENLIANVANSRIILRHIMPALAQLGPCECQTALANAIITDRDMIPSEVRRRLQPIAGKRLDPPPN
ncbi:MAG: S-methyl-5'-thioadenosine phosphorylase [Chloroflexi bacterium]|nr:S-methyl-5'-thioadenosine phosphorylase [Chloroflexota bacterium]